MDLETRHETETKSGDTITGKYADKTDY